MAYFLGAIYPIVLLIVGTVLLLSGVFDAHAELATAGAVLLAGVLISFSITSTSKKTP